MIKTLFKSVIAGAILLASPQLADAKTPSEVLVPYKQYVAALEAGNTDKAGEFAELAYDEALRLMGDDDPLVGTLAHNLADLSYDDPERQIKLYKQAITLTPVKTEEDVIIVAQRWVALGQIHALRTANSRADFKSSVRDINDGWDFIEEKALTGTTFGGEMMVLKGWAAASNNKVDEALEWYEKADTVFSGPEHQYFSILEYTNKVLRGKTLIVYDRDIEGAIVLQDVMQNSEGQLPAEHPYIKDAFHNWLWARSKIEQAGDTEEAESAGVCKCWPYDEFSAKSPVPIVRMAPDMPRTARRSGRVMFRFDVTREGVPENIEVLGRTTQSFVKPATRSVKRWRYDVNEDHSDEDLQNIVTTIRFHLVNEFGRILPEDDMVMLIDNGQ